MSTPPIIDFNQIRIDHDLKTIVTKYLGPARNGKWLCPFHEEKTPSFALTKEGDKFRCYGACGITGDVVDFIALIENLRTREAVEKLGSGYILDLGLTPIQLKAKQAELRAEYQKRHEEQRIKAQQRRAKALERVAGMVNKVDWYHGQVKQALDYWLGEGIAHHTIEAYKLGYCPSFPIWKEIDGAYQVVERIPSYVIPYFHKGKLINIRHRLKGREADKYRPEFGGLPAQLFNLDALDDLSVSLLEPGECALVEGEKKSIFLGQACVQAVGMPGVETWKAYQEEWLPLFRNTSTIYVILDPNAERVAREITAAFNNNGINAIMVLMPCKPDDYFTKHGGSVDGFMRIVAQGRKR